ncbi:hypothetical protein COT49_02395 [candidate division WWE3 bacterium CG08_land_8_20_14_0_20_40_13]|uniref:PPM-type phosphatase domain-containing protein n=1 Tax=candidate division WWE3 bacterium CG08_land_8_20_14_0_20_40_13 TaxID=1975084 RepID=A0A2H0XDL3_UNCKA|nr:MAG: hypothetical protein COT49_02395 [candidate division WWE3 bacterium CG08_land_8_20_14_0_20_40_13]
MDTPFNIRTQKIEGSKEPVAGFYSSVLEGAGDSRDAMEQRGKLFAVVELAGGEGCDLKLAMSLAKNTLSESYFGNLEGTPLSALERAVSETKEIISNLSGDTGSCQISMSLGAVVLWGNVVYLAQMGDNQTLLLRNSSAVTLGEETGGDVKLHSSVLEDGDVFVCATGLFLRKFSVDFILKNSLKIEEEIAAFQENFRLCACVISVSGKVALSPRDFIKIASPISQRSKGLNKRAKIALLSFAFATILSAGVYSINKVKPFAGSARKEVGKEVVTISEIVKEKEINYAKPIFEYAGLSDITVSKVFVDGEEIKAVDFKAGKLWTLEKDGTKVKSEDITGLVEQLPENYSGLAPYLGNWYALSPPLNKIVKITVGSGGFTASDWLKEEGIDLSTSEDLAVDYHVYVLMSDGTVIRYLSGQKTAFSLVSEDSKMTNPTKIFTSAGTKNLYIWDAGEKSVFMFKKDGEFVKKAQITENLKETGVMDMFVIEGDVTEVYLSTTASLYKFEI